MSLFQYAKAHTGLAVILTLASQRDAFARQTAMILDIVSKACGQDVSKEEALGIARAADGEVRSVVQHDATAVVPVRGQEISRVLARRLFTRIDQGGAATTADAYLDMYRRTALLLPEQARQETYRARLIAHYPFHPTLIDYLTDKLATVESFQGTRGVLRVLALTVANLWRRQVPAPMIHACHLDLRDPRLSDELVSRTESAELMPIINADLGGPDSGDLKGLCRRSGALMPLHCDDRDNYTGRIAGTGPSRLTVGRSAKRPTRPVRHRPEANHDNRDPA